MEEKKIYPYRDSVQTKDELVFKTYEYHLPFNYPNITVERNYGGGEFHGMELFPVAEVKPPKSTSGKPAEGIVILEDDPIVKVVVIGSACTPPGYVTLEAEPCEDFRRNGEVVEVMPLRFRIDNLWGMHLRIDQWAETKGGRTFPENIPDRYKQRFSGFRCTSREFPLAGMSSAIFEIPKSKKIRISGGSQIPGWTDDNYADDLHYSIRIIRTTVSISRKSDNE